MRFIRFTLLAVLGCLLQGTLWSSQTNPSKETETDFPYNIRIDDSSSFVGLALVKLKVSELSEEDGRLVGRYEIRVPLSKKYNDSGTISLQIPQDILNMDDVGGKLVGEAISEKPTEPPSGVVCKVYPGEQRTIVLAITTNNRTIEFKSRYNVIVINEDGSRTELDAG